MPYRITLDIQLRPTQSGLSLRAQLVTVDGANSGAEITAGFVEIGSGAYLWDYPGMPDGFRGGLKVLRPDGTMVAFAAISPEALENSDAKVSSRLASDDYAAPDNATIGAVGAEVAAIRAKTDTLGAARITAVSPVGVSGDMQIIKGDDYSASDGSNRVFEWSDDESAWPDLDGATI
ncbi:MAG TPA: hypothetical protein VF762_11015, partial [Blastocatellia bacterium]